MRNTTKKFISFILAATMALSTFVTQTVFVSADVSTTFGISEDNSTTSNQSTEITTISTVQSKEVTTSSLTEQSTEVTAIYIEQSTELITITTMNGICGKNVTYTLTPAKTFTISGTGDMTDYSPYSNAPWYEYRLYLEDVFIEDGVTNLGDYAFAYCSNITSIEIPNSVTSIGSSTFEDCAGLTNIEIPKSVTSISSFAFLRCGKLANIYYTGTEDEWNSIDKANAEIPDTAVVHYNYNGGDKIIAIGSWGENVTYTLTNNGILTISGTGDMANYTPDSALWDKKRLSSYLKNVFIEDGVTSICESAFVGCSRLESIEIPNSVTSIGDNAFSSCKKLTGIEIPNSVTSIGEFAFEGCGNLTAINVDEQNEYYCSENGVLFNKDKTTIIKMPIKNSLTSYKIPNSVISIGNYAFRGCSNLTSIEIPSSVTSIGNSVFYDCSSLTSIEIPSSVTSIGNSAFNRCGSLTSIEIPNSVTSIGNSAFYYCSKLADIYYAGTEDEWNSIDKANAEIPDTAVVHYNYNGEDKIIAIGSCGENVTYTLTADGILTINGTGDIADYNYTSTAPWYENRLSIKNVIIENGVTSIGDFAFLGFTITSIEIPNSVISIGDYTFEYCNRLINVEIPNSVTSIGNSAFYGCGSLTSIGIPSSVTSIGNSAFYGCGSLTSIEIPSSVTSIGNSAFNRCGSLTSIEIPSSVTSIGNNSFNGCSNLTSIIIPESVTSIGDNAFTGCDKLTNVTHYYTDHTLSQLTTQITASKEINVVDDNSVSINKTGERTFDIFVDVSKFGGYNESAIYLNEVKAVVNTGTSEQEYTTTYFEYDDNKEHIIFHVELLGDNLIKPLNIRGEVAAKNTADDTDLQYFATPSIKFEFGESSSGEIIETRKGLSKEKYNTILIIELLATDNPVNS